MNFAVERFSIIEKFIGPYAQTDDFAFQQQIRSLDLTIKHLASIPLGDKKAENFCTRGWGLLLGAAYLLEKNPSQLKITDAYKKIIEKEIQEIILHNRIFPNPFSTENVAEKTCDFITHQEQKPRGFKRVDIPPILEDLNSLVKNVEIKFTFNKGTRLYLELGFKFFNDLWKTNLPSLLESKELVGLEKNKECPHVTLIGSSAIHKIKKACENEIEFNSFMDNLLEEINNRLKEEKDPIVFTKLATKYTENYPSFEEIVVAYLDSPVIESALSYFQEKIKEELNIQISVTPKASYHVTIAVKYRDPGNFSENVTIEDLIKETGSYAQNLHEFWESLTKTQIATF